MSEECDLFKIMRIKYMVHAQQLHYLLGWIYI